jgi:hypothetical protein
MHRWKFSVLAAAAVACSGFYASDASALALGRITVQSALGEPLRAEIDLPQITPAEADTLRATAAAPEVFRAQGMEYTQAMNNLHSLAPDFRSRSASLACRARASRPKTHRIRRRTGCAPSCRRSTPHPHGWRHRPGWRHGRPPRQ